VKNSIFTLLNAVGCLILTSLVAFQWSKERGTHRITQDLRSALADSESRHTKEIKKTSALERDVAVLKEAVAATQAAAETSAKDNASHSTKAALLQTELAAALDQAKSWEASIAARDTKLKELNSELIVTRRRLDEAIVTLKAAGAR